VLIRTYLSHNFLLLAFVNMSPQSVIGITSSNFLLLNKEKFPKCEVGLHENVRYDFKVLEHCNDCNVDL
jgi:hypothetical protein